VFLPVWAAIYAFTLEPPSAGASDPLALGGALYNGKATCAACHGGSGEGGVGPAFQNGAVEKTWPNWRDHFLWVKTGADAWPGDNYGAEQTPKDKVPGVMPGFGPGSGSELTDDEILLVMRYEREVLGGGEPDPVLVQLTECAAAGQDLSSILDALQPGTGAGGTSEPPATPEACTP
jgi:mono/diheme cytochrome c family protein